MDPFTFLARGLFVPTFGGFILPPIRHDLPAVVRTAWPTRTVMLWTVCLTAMLWTPWLIALIWTAFLTALHCTARTTALAWAAFIWTTLLTALLWIIVHLPAVIYIVLRRPGGFATRQSLISRTICVWSQWKKFFISCQHSSRTDVLMLLISGCSRPALTAFTPFVGSFRSLRLTLVGGATLNVYLPHLLPIK